jgi:hypothetical protein
VQYEVVLCPRFKKTSTPSGRVPGSPAACSLALGADDERPLGCICEVQCSCRAWCCVVCCSVWSKKKGGAKEKGYVRRANTQVKSGCMKVKCNRLEPRSQRPSPAPLLPTTKPINVTKIRAFVDCKPHLSPEDILSIAYDTPLLLPSLVGGGEAGIFSSSSAYKNLGRLVLVSCWPRRSLPPFHPCTTSTAYRPYKSDHHEQGWPWSRSGRSDRRRGISSMAVTCPADQSVPSLACAASVLTLIALWRLLWECYSTTHCLSLLLTPGTCRYDAGTLLLTWLPVPTRTRLVILYRAAFVREPVLNLHALLPHQP